MEFKYLDPDECTTFLNLRMSVDPLKFGDLKASIREWGIRQSVNARPHPNKPGKYEVYAGRLRLRAAQELKAEGYPIRIPALISHASGLEVYTITLTENVDRADVSPYAIGNWLQMMQMKFGLSQRALAEGIKKSQPWVNRHLQIVKEVQSRNISSEIDIEKLESLPPTERHARALRSLDPGLRQQVFNQASETGEFPSAREIERKASASTTPEAILSRYQPSTVDDDFMEYLLQEEAGLMISEAKKRVQEWRWGRRKRSETGPKISPSDPVVQLYSKLSQYFPYEVIDIVSKVAPAKTFDTMVKYCRRYVARLFSKAPPELRQAALEEWML